MFKIYLELGFEHLVDINAYDHMLFLVALCAIYRLSELRKVLILVTAFTIGHSLTLGLAVLDLIEVPKNLVELLIPITIIITCLYNIYKSGDEVSVEENLFSRSLNLNYLFALFFGFIHGMGFSSFLKSTLMPGEENQLIGQLLAFNIGIELGQLIIVAIILSITFVFLNLLKVSQKWWTRVVSIITALVALQLLIA